jgi:hypothetical protein
MSPVYPSVRRGVIRNQSERLVRVYLVVVQIWVWVLLFLRHCNYVAMYVYVCLYIYIYTYIYTLHSIYSAKVLSSLVDFTAACLIKVLFHDALRIWQLTHDHSFSATTYPSLQRYANSESVAVLLATSHMHGVILPQGSSTHTGPPILTASTRFSLKSNLVWMVFRLWRTDLVHFVGVLGLCEVFMLLIFFDLLLDLGEGGNDNWQH